MKREEGLTLIELLITTVILGVVMSAIIASVITGLRTTDTATKRLSESHDTQMVSAFFVTDAQGAEDVSLTDTTCAGTTPVVRFRWVDNVATKIASYFVRTASGETQLVRAYCENGVTVSTVPVVHSLSTATPGCAPSCTATPNSVAVCVREVSGYSFTIGGSRRGAATPAPVPVLTC